MSQKPLQLVFSTAHDLYYETLKQLLLKGEEVSSVKQKNSIGSGWGNRERPTKELRYVNLILQNPLNRIVNAPIFHLTSAIPRTLLSTLSDEIALDVMQFYNPRAGEFSDDEKTIPTNYGYRVRHFDGHNQLQLVIDQLKKDRTSRRAVIHIHSVADYDRRYTPCIDSLHFLVRNGALECQAFWRSENAFTLLPYNLFEFTMLQELVASELQIPVGCFVQTVTSLHYYLDDQERIEASLKKVEKSAAPAAMGAMPFSSLDQITRMRELERSVRLHTNLPLAEHGLNPYWKAIFDVLHFYVLEKNMEHEKASSVLENSPWKDFILEKTRKANPLLK